MTSTTSNPDQMIRGAVDDPLLTLDNAEIIRRHVTAYLLQRYHRDKLPTINLEEQPHLFAVLGTVADFKKSAKVLNRWDLKNWLEANEAALRAEVDAWLPQQFSTAERKRLLDELVPKTMEPIDAAIEFEPPASAAASAPAAAPARRLWGRPTASSADTALEAPDEEGEEKPGVTQPPRTCSTGSSTGCSPSLRVPRPTSPRSTCSTRSTRQCTDPLFSSRRHRASPLRSQYAPGKEVWIGNKLWTSEAIYSPMRDDRYRAWLGRRLYYECSVCHYARTTTFEVARVARPRTARRAVAWVPLALPRSGSARPLRAPCEQAGGHLARRHAREELRDAREVDGADPADASKWKQLNERLVHHTRQHLLVTNRGPREEGYTYCTGAGSSSPLRTQRHRRGGAPKAVSGYQGADVPRRRRDEGFGPRYGLHHRRLARRDPCRRAYHARARRACDRRRAAHDLRGGDQGSARGLSWRRTNFAEYRPALTPEGRAGLESEIYIYDTLPGGAGFAKRVGDIGLPIFEDALKLLRCARTTVTVPATAAFAATRTSSSTTSSTAISGRVCCGSSSTTRPRR